MRQLVELLGLRRVPKTAGKGAALTGLRTSLGQQDKPCALERKRLAACDDEEASE